MDLHLVEQPARSILAWSHRAAGRSLAGGRLCLRNAGCDAIGHEPDVAGGGPGGMLVGNEDWYAVVVVAVPPVSLFKGATAGNDGSGGHHLVEDRGPGLDSRPIGTRIPGSVAQPSCDGCPSTPIGFSIPSSGPVIKPSNDIDMSNTSWPLVLLLSVSSLPEGLTARDGKSCRVRSAA